MHVLLTKLSKSIWNMKNETKLFPNSDNNKILDDKIGQGGNIIQHTSICKLKYLYDDLLLQPIFISIYAYYT